jgi:hypothetical protein
MRCRDAALDVREPSATVQLHKVRFLRAMAKQSSYWRTTLISAPPDNPEEISFEKVQRQNREEKRTEFVQALVIFRLGEHVIGRDSAERKAVGKRCRRLWKDESVQDPNRVARLELTRHPAAIRKYKMNMSGGSLRASDVLRNLGKIAIVLEERRQRGLNGTVNMMIGSPTRL